MSIFGKSKYTQQLEASIKNQEEAARQLELSKKQQDTTTEQQLQHEDVMKRTLDLLQAQSELIDSSVEHAERFESLLNTWESLAGRLDTILSKVEDKVS